MKKPDIVLREYVSRLSLDNLKFLVIRLSGRTGDDLAEAIEAMSTNQDIDKWFSTAKSCMEFYDMIDLVQNYVEREMHKRTPELIEA